MNLTVIIGVAIGVMFVWILLALITSQVQDLISQWFKWKANMLEGYVQNMLADPQLATEFYNHPLIKGLHSENGKRKPSYIPQQQFASVVFDLLLNSGTEESAANQAMPVFERLHTNIENIKKGSAAGNLQNLARVMDTLLLDVTENIKKSDAAIGEARTRIENWFNDAMDRLGGAYKRRMQFASLLIGIAIASVLNADSLAIANKLWREPLVREELVAQAAQFQLPNQQGVNNEQAAQKYAQEVQSLSVPIGWSAENMPTNDFSGWVLKISGLLLSGVAAAQGAPFWFEIMRKLINLRGGGGAAAAPEPAAK